MVEIIKKCNSGCFSDGPCKRTNEKFGIELYTYIPQAIATTVMCDWTDTRQLCDTLHDPHSIPATGVPDFALPAV